MNCILNKVILGTKFIFLKTLSNKWKLSLTPTGSSKEISKELSKEISSGCAPGIWRKPTPDGTCEMQEGISVFS